jgi:hypothetical protein
MAAYQNSTGFSEDSMKHNILRMPKEPSINKQQHSSGNQSFNVKDTKAKKRGRPRKEDAEALK